MEVLSLSLYLQMDARQHGGHTSERTTHSLPSFPDSTDVIIWRNDKIYEGVVDATERKRLQSTEHLSRGQLHDTHAWSIIHDMQQITD